VVTTVVEFLVVGKWRWAAVFVGIQAYGPIWRPVARWAILRAP